MTNMTLKQVQPDQSLNETLKAMNQLENLTLKNQNFIDWTKKVFANDCRDCIPFKVWEFIYNHFRYVDDQYDEVIRAPYVLLYEKIGDCDDFALFAHTVLKILGFKPMYIMFGEYRNRFTHIAVFCNDKIIDGVNQNFNVIPIKYNFYKTV